MEGTISIRRSLLINLILIALLLGGAIIAVTFLGARRSIRVAAGELMEQAVARVESYLQGFFDPIQRELMVVKSWNREGLIDIEDPMTFRALAKSLIREYPWITAVDIGAADGSGQAVTRLSDGSWYSRRVNREVWGERGFIAEWRDGEAPVEREESSDYDPRTRPWYQGAIARGGEEGIHWTEPYVFYTRQIPGMSASVAMIDPDAKDEVMSLDVTLLDVSRFTAGLEVHRNGRAFVLTEDGRVVGLPRNEAFSDPASVVELLLMRPEQIGTEIAADLGRALLDPGEPRGRPVRFVSGGDAWWGMLKPYRLPASDRTLLVGVAVPEDDLLGRLQEQRLLILLITGGVLALAVGRAVSMARSYSRPFEQLAEESDRIGEGNLEPGEPIQSGVTEVRRLASAHDRMRRGLRKLLKVEKELELARQIQQATFPTVLPEIEGYELAAWSEPADETGGDTYDVIGYRKVDGRIALTDEGAERVIFLLGDATGHGIGPALSSTQLRAMLRMAIRLSADPGEILRNVNEQLAADLPTGRFITAWLAELDPDAHTLTSLSAGQAPLLHYRAAEDRCEVLNADTMPLGLFGGLSMSHKYPQPLAPGDIYAVISDGIFEAVDPHGQEFEVHRTVEIIRSHRDSSLAELMLALRGRVDDFTGHAPYADDRTIVMIKRNP